METNLKAIELRDLWRRYKDEKDEKARERLVLAYAPLVKYVAGRMSSGLPSHVEEADLISYGLLGLISAIERFEPEREIKFETFAITRIKEIVPIWKKEHYDDGETWERVLHVDEHTGAADLSMDPNDPDVMFAAMWQAVRHPWDMRSGGPGSDLFRTLDGGRTWQPMSASAGFPTGVLGDYFDNPLSIVLYAPTIAIISGLETAMLRHAYRAGLFPMAELDMEPGRPEALSWWSPRRRGVLPLRNLRVTRSLAKSCHELYRVTVTKVQLPPSTCWSRMLPVWILLDGASVFRDFSSCSRWPGTVRCTPTI